jgi:predicted DNA-binding protein
MLDNDDPDAPNGGKTHLLRMSKETRRMLDHICKQTGYTPTQMLRLMIGLTYGIIPDGLTAAETLRALRKVYEDNGLGRLSHSSLKQCKIGLRSQI